MNDGATAPLNALLEAFGGNAMKLYRETGILLSIGGGAKGYNEVADLLTRTVDGVDQNELWDEFNETIDILNEQRGPLVERLTFQVTEPFEEVMPIVTEEFEEADEYAQPKGIRLGRPWNMGFPLKYHDLASRFTFRFLGRVPASQLRAINNTALEADQWLVYKTILTRVFDNRTFQATLEDTGTVVNTYPFFNGDQTALPAVPPTWKSYTHLNTHTHYLVSNGATVDSGDLDEMWLHIYHHGYTQAGASIILLVNRTQANTIRSFRVSTGSMYDFIPATVRDGVPVRFILDGQIIGGQPGDDSGLGGVFPGFIGTYGPITVVEEDLIPAGYMFMFASGGRFADRNPVGLREHPNAALRGLKLIPQFERYPLRESFYHHALGAGVRHMAAGVVMQVKASGSYEIPSLARGGPGGR